jgi:hypothetical protein
VMIRLLRDPKARRAESNVIATMRELTGEK